jgi:hypothetical protein
MPVAEVAEDWTIRMKKHEERFEADLPNTESELLPLLSNVRYLDLRQYEITLSLSSWHHLS